MPTPTVPAGLLAGGRFPSWRPAVPGWVLLDVDGTLLSADGVRPAVRAAVTAAAAAGLRLGVATGRMRPAALRLAGELGLSGPHVLNNGAEVHDGTAALVTLPLPDGAAGTLRHLSAVSGCYAELYTADGFVVTRDEPRAHLHWATLGQDPDGDASRLTAADEVLKATFMCFDAEDTRRVVAGVEEAGLVAGPAHSPATPGVTYVNATAAGVDKGAAASAGARALGLGMQQLVALGDADNDLPLLRVVGTAIAMGQADESVRDAAHLVAPSVDADGAATALTWLASLV